MRHAAGYNRAPACMQGALLSIQRKQYLALEHVEGLFCMGVLMQWSCLALVEGVLE